ncbi:MAG: hypothetical protein R3254_00520 [Thiomicrorhabdus sp.]|nr:hypothetical protein [Thiomicrorhabdus sp.]
MFNHVIAAYIFGSLTIIVMLFQLALTLGAPWGEMAMGGKFPGRYSIKLRIAAFIQFLILGFMALVVLTHAGLLLPEWYAFSQKAIWLIVILSAIIAILNTITPSKKERILWSPITIILFICALIVAQN